MCEHPTDFAGRGPCCSKVRGLSYNFRRVPRVAGGIYVVCLVSLPQRQTGSQEQSHQKGTEHPRARYNRRSHHGALSSLVRLLQDRRGGPEDQQSGSSQKRVTLPAIGHLTRLLPALGCRLIFVEARRVPPISFSRFVVGHSNGGRTRVPEGRKANGLNTPAVQVRYRERCRITRSPPAVVWQVQL